jgi:hypothetical protein
MFAEWSIKARHSALVGLPVNEGRRQGEAVVRFHDGVRVSRARETRNGKIVQAALWEAVAGEAVGLHSVRHAARSGVV